MKLTDDKISHLTHVILKGLLEKGAVTALDEEAHIRREIKRVIIKELKIVDAIDESVRKNCSPTQKRSMRAVRNGKSCITNSMRKNPPERKG